MQRPTQHASGNNVGELEGHLHGVDGGVQSPLWHQSACCVHKDPHSKHYPHTRLMQCAGLASHGRGRVHMKAKKKIETAAHNPVAMAIPYATHTFRCLPMMRAIKKQTDNIDTARARMKSRLLIQLHKRSSMTAETDSSSAC